MKYYFILLFLFSLNAQTILDGNRSSYWDGGAAPAGGQDYSDDFNRTDADPPSGNWEEITGGGTDWAILSNELEESSVGEAGQSIAYTLDCDGVTQYVCVQLVDGEGGGIFRYTGTASDGYYCVHAYHDDGNIYWESRDNGGWNADIGSGSLNPGANDYIGITVQGTGSGTIISAWDLGATPASFTPYDKDNWLNGSDTADITITDDPGGNNADTGLQVGIGCYTDNVHTYDNWYGGDTE